MNNNVHVTGAFGPTLPAGWSVVAALRILTGMVTRLSTVQREHARHSYLVHEQQCSCHRLATGPTLPAGWSVVGVADFNGDGHPDYLLFNAQHPCHSHLVHEQQRSCLRQLWPDTPYRLGPGRSWPISMATADPIICFTIRPRTKQRFGT